LAKAHILAVQNSFKNISPWKPMKKIHLKAFLWSLLLSNAVQGSVYSIYYTALEISDLVANKHGFGTKLVKFQ